MFSSVFFAKCFQNCNLEGCIFTQTCIAIFVRLLLLKNFVKNSNEKVLNEGMSIWYDIIGLQVKLFEFLKRCKLFFWSSQFPSRQFPKQQLPKSVLAAALGRQHALAVVLGPLAHLRHSTRPSMFSCGAWPPSPSYSQRSPEHVLAVVLGPLAHLRHSTRPSMF